VASYQRIALYILFDAIETDIVSLLRALRLPDGTELLSSEERNKALVRLQNQSAAQQLLHPDADLLTGLDIGDKIAIVQRHKRYFATSARDHFSQFYDPLIRAIPIRNAVMHGRPLTTNDYASAFSLADDLNKYPHIWPTLYKTYKDFTESPDTVLATSFEFLETNDFDSTLHNLPAPDYDDTGFVPRPDLERELKKKILGRHPVVTVLGDGGNGKTALALQVLYDLLSTGDHEFDAIVWTSAKSNKLSTNEIIRIEDAITDSIGIFTTVADQFEPGDLPPLERVRKLLDENRILLVIDNLETVLDPTIKDFAIDVPGQSKILFTSRVPLGSDLSVVVDEFSDEEARNFLFRLRDAYNIERLRKIKLAAIDSYLRKLSKKPLLIKWFALGIVSGLQPDAIVRNPDMALRFCMENVIDKLSESSKRIAKVMSTVPSTLSAAVLSHILSIPASQIEAGLSELLRFALIERDDNANYERKYFVKPFARSYITKNISGTPEESARYIARYRDSEAAFQFERGGALYDRYNPRSFVVRSRSEALVARRLRHAVSLAFKGKYEAAESEIDELKIASPEYFEVFRAEAFIAYRTGDYPRAHSSYEAALELDSNQPQVNYFFAGFLMRTFSDYEKAKVYFKKALKIDPDSPQVLREAARNYFFLLEFDEAKKCLDRAMEIGSTKIRDTIILNDLLMQYYIRKSEHQEATGDPRGAVKVLKDLYEFLDKYDHDQFDQMMIGHLSKVNTVIDKLSKNIYVNDSDFLGDIKSLVSNFAPSVTVEKMPDEEPEIRFLSGVLKDRGRTETFGFLRDIWGTEVYLARNSVDADLWDDLVNGQRVMFEVGISPNGLTYAKNVTRL